MVALVSALLLVCNAKYKLTFAPSGQYVVHSELTGHSGVRVHSCTPSPISWLLTMLDMELVIEDQYVISTTQFPNHASLADPSQ